MPTVHWIQDRSFPLLTSMLFASLVPLASGAPALDNLIAEQTAADRAAQTSQARVNRLDDETQDMLSKYRRALEDTQSITTYNKHLSEQVQAQRAELAGITEQLARIETTSRDVYPLMQKMVDTLPEFVALDVPFQLAERTRRVENLEGLMGRADVSVSEKFRRILEAYQIEMESGRTIEAYEGVLGEGDAERVVEFVRVGRVALLYRRPDGTETGYYDMSETRWVADESYAHAVEEALRVAKKLGAPDLLRVPVPAPIEVRQ